MNVESYILVVDDEPPMQARLERILATIGHPPETLRCCETIAQAKAAARDSEPALALIDLGLPDGNGVELVGWLHARFDALPILVISAWSTEEMILAALRAGAGGYVLKERDDIEIALSLKSAFKGGAPIDPFIARRILDLIAVPDPANPSAVRDDRLPSVALTARERDILARVADGLSNREIAAAAGLSPWTVDSHVRAIYRKLAVNSRTQAVREARSLGLLR